MRFLVRIYRVGKSYSAMVPDLPGCVAAGGSLEEVRQLIAEAIGLHVNLMRKSGEAIPEPASHFDIDNADVEDDEWITWVKMKRPKAVRR